MDNSLDNILNGTSVDEQVAEVVETPPAEPVVEAAPEAPATPDRPRDEHGRFLPKGDNEPEPAAEAAPAESASPAPKEPELEHPALIGERRRRQTAELERDELRQQLAKVTQPPAPQTPQAIPNEWDEGWGDYVKAEAVKEARQEAIVAVRNERVMASAEAAKVKYPDYVDKVPIFEKLATENPALWGNMLQHPNPAEYAYSIAKDHEEMGQYGSLEARDAAKKKEWEAQALEALKAQLAPQTAPPTLSNERNVGSRAGPEWSGPKSLGDILAT